MGIGNHWLLMAKKEGGGVWWFVWKGVGGKEIGGGGMQNVIKLQIAFPPSFGVIKGAFLAWGERRREKEGVKPKGRRESL